MVTLAYVFTFFVGTRWRRCVAAGLLHATSTLYSQRVGLFVNGGCVTRLESIDSTSELQNAPNRITNFVCDTSIIPRSLPPRPSAGDDYRSIVLCDRCHGLWVQPKAQNLSLTNSRYMNHSLPVINLLHFLYECDKPQRSLLFMQHHRIEDGVNNWSLRS